MAITQVQVSVPAGATQDILNGTVYQFAPWNAAIAMNLNAAAAGCEATILTGSDLIMGPSAPITFQTLGTPLTTEGYTIQDVVARGERIVCSIVNTTGADIVVTLSMNISPV